jgi:predicted  nucleic acid-binding Zn-ribbon protein
VGFKTETQEPTFSLISRAVLTLLRNMAADQRAQIQASRCRTQSRAHGARQCTRLEMQLNSELKAANAALKSAQQRLADMAAEREALQSEVCALANDNERLRALKDNAALISDCERLREEMREANALNATLRFERDAARNWGENFKKQSDAAQARELAITARLEELLKKVQQ